MSVKLILVGCGWAGEFHALAAAAHRQADLAAIVDTNEEKAAAFARKMGTATIPHFRTLEQLAESGLAYDGALICTLPDSHIALCSYFLERNKHVLCEKPMGRSSAHIRKLAADFGPLGRQAGVNCNQRFAPAYRKVKERIAGGEKVHMIHLSMQQHGPVVPGGHVDSYFLLTDACCHLVDTLRYLNGEITGVHAFGKQIDSEIVSDVTVNLEFENGSVGVMTHTFAGGVHETQHPFQRLDLTTNTARYTVENMMDDLRIYPHDGLLHQVWAPSAFERRDYGLTMLDSVSAWIDSVVAGVRAPVDWTDAYRNARVIEACIESMESGKVVRLNEHRDE